MLINSFFNFRLTTKNNIVNTFYNKILSIGMSCVVLFSTLSFSVELHYCCDNLIDIGIFAQAKTCSDKSNKNDKIHCDESCCHNDQLNKIAHNDLKKSSNNYFNPILKIFTNNSIIGFDIFLELKKDPNTYNDYRPPLLFKDFTILHESFLI